MARIPYATGKKPGGPEKRATRPTWTDIAGYSFDHGKKKYFRTYDYVGYCSVPELDSILPLESYTNDYKYYPWGTGGTLAPAFPQPGTQDMVDYLKVLAEAKQKGAKGAFVRGCRFLVRTNDLMTNYNMVAWCAKFKDITCFYQFVDNEGKPLLPPPPVPGAPCKICR